MSLHQEIPSPAMVSDSMIAPGEAEGSSRTGVTLLILILPVLYCLLHYFLGHLKPVHVLFSLLVLGLYFASSYSRAFTLLAIPFALKDILFDGIRYVHFDWLKPIHVSGPYHLDLAWFGVSTGASSLLFNEYLLRFSHPVLDFFSGLIYFLNEPVALLLIFLFWMVRSKALAERYSTAFLVMNLFAFLTYVFFPVAPPWYVAKYGLVQPMVPVLGDAAGLLRFDHLIGFPLAARIYGANPVVFGAIPSMHAGFSMLGWIYSLRTNWKWAFAMTVYTLFMWFSALYLQHHYVIDLVLGIFYALASYAIVEFCLSGWIGRVYRFLTKCLIQEGPRTLWE